MKGIDTGRAVLTVDGDARLSAVLAREPARAAVLRAEDLGLVVVVRDLGAWGERIRPCAELDARASRVVLDRRTLLAACERLGAGLAAELAAAAIAHELAHVADPSASEATIRLRTRAGGSDGDALVRDAIRGRRA